jgi:hypothetical protein
MTRTNETTKAILTYLNHKGYKAWRNNNNAVYSVKQQSFRKNPTALKGVSDILGFNKSTGLIIAIEIKTGKDKASPEQELFINDVNASGGIGLFVKTFDEFLLLHTQIQETKPKK